MIRRPFPCLLRPFPTAFVPVLFALWGNAVMASEITVFAAASLKTAFDDIAAAYEDDSGHSLTVSYAGSSALARQIELGAPADLFISANPDWMDHLVGLGRIAQDTRYDLLTNRLVLIAHGAAAPEIKLSAELDLVAELDRRPLAMALVNAVPAGIYGKAALERLGLWDQVADKVAQTDNARTALALVSLGEARLGIVYATDALAEPAVSTVATFPEESHPPILYPVAAVSDRITPEVQNLLDYLKGPEAKALFTSHGFAVIGDQ